MVILLTLGIASFSLISQETTGVTLLSETDYILQESPAGKRSF
jgi:hypothetical protein